MSKSVWPSWGALGALSGGSWALLGPSWSAAPETDFDIDTMPQSSLADLGPHSKPTRSSTPDADRAPPTPAPSHLAQRPAAVPPASSWPRPAACPGRARS
eukprot:1980838-Pyramimonas_sp.AAC.1